MLGLSKMNCRPCIYLLELWMLVSTALRIAPRVTLQPSPQWSKSSRTTIDFAGVLIHQNNKCFIIFNFAIAKNAYIETEMVIDTFKNFSYQGDDPVSNTFFCLIHTASA